MDGGLKVYNMNEIEKMYDFTKYAFEEISNKIRNIINQPCELLIKIAEDKKLNHYSYMYGSVKSKRLKKKYKNKFDKRLKEIKGNK